ncbi:MAG: DegT/DnrJ/EryC1/StrS family aminotransferase [SAR324 cluster bacterium]|nr:DegT/DnrJ/EryC1/StrS family aminotransferase [SAR324 cluster bacterium]
MITVPYANIAWQWQAIKDDVLKELPDFFEKSSFCLGETVQAFEEEFAKYIGVKYAIGVNSGTSALHLALLAAKIGEKDKVLIPDYTFIATAWAPCYVGASPIFCDVDADSYNIDLIDAEKRLDDKVKAIIPVHLYGQPADMQRVQEFAEKHNLVVIEDAAQSHGAYYNGKMSGSLSKAGCFSFYPTKNLGTAGEGGMVVTDDYDFAQEVKSLRNHGEKERYLHSVVGYNYRMEGIHGLILGHKLKYLDKWNAMRRDIATKYYQELANSPIKLPKKVGSDHVYNLFVIQFERRDELRKYLMSKNIATGLHYPTSLHAQPCFKHLNMKNFPVASELSKRCISLPIFPGMTDEQIYHITDSIKGFFKNN